MTMNVLRRSTSCIWVANITAPNFCAHLQHSAKVRFSHWAPDANDSRPIIVRSRGELHVQHTQKAGARLRPRRGDDLAGAGAVAIGRCLVRLVAQARQAAALWQEQ